MLTANPETEVMTHTAMRADLSETIKIFSHLEVELISNELGGLTVLEVALTVKKVVGDLELTGVLDDSNDAIDFLVGQRSSTLRKVDIGLLENKVGESTTDTLDGGEGVHDLLTTLDVGVEYTKDVLKLLSLHYDRHGCECEGGCGRGMWLTERLPEGCDDFGDDGETRKGTMTRV